MSQKWPLLSGITRNVRKLASLSGSRNFRWGGGGGLFSELYNGYNNLTLWDVKGPPKTEQISGSDMCLPRFWVSSL